MACLDNVRKPTAPTTHSGQVVTGLRVHTQSIGLRFKVVADIPDELIKLECSAEEERAKLAGLDGEAYDVQWRTWRDAAAAFQGAVTEYAAREGVGMSRFEVEQAVKRVVRHAEPQG
jgi:hypothetical protein